MVIVGQRKQAIFKPQLILKNCGFAVCREDGVSSPKPAWPSSHSDVIRYFFAHMLVPDAAYKLFERLKTCKYYDNYNDHNYHDYIRLRTPSRITETTTTTAATMTLISGGAAEGPARANQATQGHASE